MIEKEFGLKFRVWYLENRIYPNATFEYKVCDNVFNLKAWREGKQSHQVYNLHSSTNGEGLFFKIPDFGYQNPLDAFFVSTVDALLVMYFNKHKEFFMVPIQDVPDTDSISYNYCQEHFTANKLLKKEKVKVIDF